MSPFSQISDLISNKLSYIGRDLRTFWRTIYHFSELQTIKTKQTEGSVGGINGTSLSAPAAIIIIKTM